MIRRTSLQYAALLLCSALMAACTDDWAARTAAFNQLVGQPEQALLQTMGVPTRSYETGDVKYLAYDERSVDFIPGTPGVGIWRAGAMLPQSIELWCETTFQVAQGTVRSFTLRGNACS